jgi:DNA-binding XRE family transcriptional regulator
MPSRRKRSTLSAPTGYVNAMPAERKVMELKLALGHWILMRRIGTPISQQELAERVGSSQQRISRLEVGESSVSLDFYVRVACALGATDEDLARALDLTRSGRVRHVRRWAVGPLAR